ncbi:PREDICTED: BRI1 kinase inhibitor 1 [Camelina sativa]|uniref:BRI1 kinase inhibitor 1 n=1 Tax=Camelina sativa TaxID=90675 RepID=A0ABM0Y1X4_CAMSA|nr:PREDICTED: BRI1 kinase inhibitor 1 [Camelina sativa]
METHLQQVKNSSQTFSEKQNPKQEALQSSPSPISSTCSSPSHDFSFTISLQPLSSSSKHISPTLRGSNKTTSSYQQTDPFAVDLSPADEIFFHGHLLPLHLLSHLPVSPRTSTGSYNDGFTLPVNEPDQPTAKNNNNNTENAITNISTEAKNNNSTGDKAEGENRVKTKPVKSFSLFGLSKWKKGFESNEREQEQQQQKIKKPMSLDLSHAVKKYIRMLFQRRGNGTQYRNRRQTSSYSFSSSLMGPNGNNKTMISGLYNKRDLIRGRRGELFSAPASMRTSPTNSGHLRVSTAGLSSSSASTSSSSSDSTMEELQAAIQAAIAHCKNSSAVDRDDKAKDS